MHLIVHVHFKKIITRLSIRQHKQQPKEYYSEESRMVLRRRDLNKFNYNYRDKLD